MAKSKTTASKNADSGKLSSQLQVYLGGILVATGVLTLLQLLTGYNIWGKGWPLVLVAGGLVIILGHKK